jgi:threonine/homoserine/homoserine lactone efflux protein
VTRRALVGGRGDGLRAALGVVCGLLLWGGLAVLGLTWLSGYAYALDRARAFLQRPRVRRAVDRLTGIVLVAFAIRLATEDA